MPHSTHDEDLPRTELQDWYDFLRTQRKVIARRRSGFRLQQLEGIAMRAAYDLLLEGKISILTRFEKTAHGQIVTYIAERVK